MQHHHGARWRSLQCGQHGVKTNAARCGVVIGVAGHVKTRVGEQSAVVLPARVADEHGRVGLQTLQEIRTHFEPTGAAKRLHRGHAATLDGFAARAKNEALYRFVVSRDAIDGQIALCLGRFEQLALGCGHAGQHRQLAVVVEINTDAQIDLVRVRVGVELFVQTQDGVSRRQFDGRKQASGGRHAKSSK